jgi:hypothetical protein
MKRFIKFLMLPVVLGYAGLCWAQDAVATAVPAADDVTKLIGDAVTGAKGGNWVLMTSAIIFLALSLLKNGERIPLFKMLGAHKLLAKIPSKHFALIITVLTAASATLTALMMKQPLSMALMAGIQAGVGSAGLHEVSKNLPGIGSATKMPTGETK